ncbi:MAG: cadherin-like domain-containing protein, partial [Anaerohalosphaera sp.]|nr:cadherin-like domain-containing protein [Anaerohalosphaera sp.]
MGIISRSLSVCSVLAALMCANVFADTPIARDDLQLTKVNTVLTCYPLANDSDADPADVLSIQSFDASSAQGGTISNNGNGTLRYTPASGFAGLD